MPSHPACTLESLKSLGRGFLPGHLGIEILDVGDRLLKARLPITPELLAPNGFLHAGSIVTLADTAAGYGCLAHLPDTAAGFTTIELKSNFMGTARGGAVLCEARALHLGGTTQVWDATVTDEASGKVISVFRCTQMVLYPRA